MEILEDYAQFVTVTALDWRPILKARSHKKIILDSLKFLVENQRIYLYGFVVMDNHFHLIWQMRHSYVMKNVQRDFLKYTDQQIKFSLGTHEPDLLKELETNGADRRYQFWQRNSLSIPLYTQSVFQQKLDYIHQNPEKAGLSDTSWNYYFSSAAYYYLNRSDFDFLSHHEG